ncbi:unnamed protein product [Urochloa humidicola]
MAWPGKPRPAAESLSLALLVVNALHHLSLAGTVLLTKPRQASTRAFCASNNELKFGTASDDSSASGI